MRSLNASGEDTPGIRFDGKAVLVTGAAGGIGIRTALLLSRLGASVLLSDREESRVRKACDELAATGAGVAWHAGDVRDSAQASAAVERCVRQFGRLDVVVNAAGVFPQVPVSRMTDDQWREVHAINLDGTFYTCRAAAKVISEGGSIVNLTSVAAHRGVARYAHYASSKAGVLALSRSLAQELAPRVRVNCVSPGPVDTTMIRALWDAAGDKLLATTPLGRLCQPDEVARVIAFMASDWASFITAETVHVNGGHYVYG